MSLERKLIVGRYIHFDPPVVQPGTYAYAAGDLVQTNQVPLTIGESFTTGSIFKGNSKRVSVVFEGQTAAPQKQHRNCQWLPWLPGALSHVPLGGLDVLTGPMSGCDLVFFNMNGVRHAGHLGTDVEKDVANNAVKTTWNGLAHRVGRFNPLRDWAGPLPAKLEGESTARMFGLLTVEDRFYTLFTYQLTEDTKKFRIAGLQRAQGVRPPAALNVALVAIGG